MGDGMTRCLNKLTLHVNRDCRLRDWAVAVCFAVFVIIMYLPSINGPFIFDDVLTIKQNVLFQLRELHLGSLVRAGFESAHRSRPLANISLALNYFFSQEETRGYHAVNMLIHLLTGISLFYFLKTTLSLPLLSSEKQDNPTGLAFSAALLWLVNPLQTQAVSYIVQRMSSMAALFFVLSLLLYARGRLADGARRLLFFAGCAGAGILALGSKPNAAALPFFIMGYEWFFFTRSGPGSRGKFRAIFLLAAVLAVVVIFGYLGSHPLDAILGTYRERDFSLVERLLTQPRVILLYATLFFLPYPSRLNLDHDIGVSSSLVEPMATALALAIIVLAAVVVISTARRRPLAAFTLLWFFGNLVIESSVIGIEIVFEHRAYLPTMLLGLPLVLMVSRLFPNRRLLQGILLAMVTVILATWCFERNRLWADDIALWGDSAAKSPGKVRTLMNYGIVLGDRGRSAEAIVQYEAALRLQPDYWEVYYNFANALRDQGDTLAAIGYYNMALQANPHDNKALLNLGVALEDLSMFEAARLNYQRLLAQDPENSMAHNNLGNVLLHLDLFDEAAAQYQAALDLDPDYADAYYNSGNLRLRQGKYRAAAGLYRQALALNDQDPDYHFYLGYVLEQLQQFNEALGHYTEAARLQPDNEAARLGRERLARRFSQ